MADLGKVHLHFPGHSSKDPGRAHGSPSAGHSPGGQPGGRGLRLEQDPDIYNWSIYRHLGPKMLPTGRTGGDILRQLTPGPQPTMGAAA